MADDDDLTRAFGSLPEPVSMPQEPRTFGRRFVGKPRLLQGIVFSAIGLVWLALLGFGFEWFRLILGAIWFLLGGVQLAVALSDRAHHRGAYAPRADRHDLAAIAIDSEGSESERG